VILGFSSVKAACKHVGEIDPRTALQKIEDCKRRRIKKKV
jgi:hypothetical protein